MEDPFYGWIVDKYKADPTSVTPAELDYLKTAAPDHAASAGGSTVTGAAPTPTRVVPGATTGPPDSYGLFPYGATGPSPATFATGGNFQIPRPGFWGGIPFTQADTKGNPLSPYANAVDQITASQKMPAPQTYGRFGFGPTRPQGLLGGAGGAGPLAGVGQPQAAPSSQSIAQVLALLRGQGPAGATPQAASAAPPTATETAAAPAAGGQSAFQQNLAYLQSVNPELARIYGLTPFHNQEYKSMIDTAQHGSAFNPQGNSWGNSMGNALINAYNEPSVGSNAQNAALGLPSGWAPAVSPQWLGQHFDPTGRNISFGGQTYTLPVADTQFAQPTAGQQSKVGWNAPGIANTFSSLLGR